MLSFIIYTKRKGLDHLHQLEETAIRKGRSKIERRMGEKEGNYLVETILCLGEVYYKT